MESGTSFIENIVNEKIRYGHAVPLVEEEYLMGGYFETFFCSGENA
jgi:hypothetical protein